MRLPAAPILAVAGLFLAAPASRAAEPTPAQADFFEKKIRPVLVEHCYACHSDGAKAKNKLKGGLLLDTRDGLLAGGDSGPPLDPKTPAKSLLLRTLRYEGDVHMPPKGKLPAAVVADFEAWVKMGAPDPRKSAAVAKKAIDIEKGRDFWAYRLPVAPPVPAVKAANWPANDIDRFILAALEAKGLKPAADADRATLARRLYFDLTGLPPAPEEVDAFVKDPDPKAYEKLVEKLLASPAFGERWGRHWLDVARYADSVTLRGLVYKEAWRYRDYVIDAFNRDVPFNRFVREQIAGDLLPANGPSEKARQIIATTYLQLGNHNLEEQDKKQLRFDVVDEQLDVITKGLLAQTVTCARCHDHKFDPIPTKDYYSLAGILANVKALETANVSAWVEVPLPSADPGKAEAVRKHEREVAALQAQIKTLKAKGAAGKAPPAARAAGIVAVKDLPGIVVDDAAAMKVGTWTESKFSGQFIGVGYSHDGNAGKGDKTITFTPDLPATGRYEVWLAYVAGTNRSPATPVTVFSADGEKTIAVDQTKAPPIDGRFLSLGTFRFERKGQSFVLVSNEGTKGHVVADAVTFIPADEPKPAAVAKTPAATPPAPPADENVKKLEAELKKLQAAGPKLDKSMAVIEEKVIEDTPVRIRGVVHNLGEVAPRGFLQVATYGKLAPMPKDQSGRVQLADWVVSKDNPLTARVYANRAWHWLFGSGIVRTTDNFGVTGEPPSHPALLDHLAVQFEKDWSVKGLVRSIVLSRTYRQSSEVRNAEFGMRNENGAAAVSGFAALIPHSALHTPHSEDPENRLFGRANRRRLEAECIRDTMLTVAGTLSGERGGRHFPDALAADYGFKHTGTTRSVYLPAFRNSLPELFEAFDYADPSSVTGKRNTSTVAPRALFLMNSPFALDQAKAAAAKLVAEKLPSDDARVTRAYRLTLGREPTAGERAVAAKFLANQSGDPKTAWATLFQALFASADFRFIN